MKVSQASQDDATPEAESLKRQLLRRAGAAASLIVVLLGGLAVYDRMHRVAPPPTLPGPPAQAESIPGAAGAALPAANPQADTLQKEDTPTEPEMARAPELAPPGQRQADAPPPLRGAPRLVVEGEPAAPALHPPHPSASLPGAPEAPVPSPGSVPRAAAPVQGDAAAGQTAAGGYLVQLGVFASPEQAEALRARLADLGIPAHLESRVVAGPFPDKAAARAAQARLREAGEGAGLLVPPHR